MLMLDALFPAADPGQLIADMDQIGAEACLVYCWRPGGVGSWTRAHVDRLHAAGRHAVASVVPFPGGGDINAQLDAVAAMGILPPSLVSLDLETPGLPAGSWEEAFDAEQRGRGYGTLDYGTGSDLGRYAPDDPEWLARWLRTGVLQPVPALPPGVRAWQFVNDVRLQSGAVYDVSVVDPSIFTGGDTVSVDDARSALNEGTVFGTNNWAETNRGMAQGIQELHNLVVGGEGSEAGLLQQIFDTVKAAATPTVDVDKLAAALAPHLQQVDEAKLVTDLEAVLPGAEVAAFRAALLKALSG